MCFLHLDFYNAKRNMEQSSWSLLLLHERMWYLFEFSFVEKTVRVKIFQYLSRYNKEARRLHAVVSWLQTLVPLVLDGVLSDLIFRQERFAFSMTASVSQSVAYKLQNTYAPEKSMSTEKLMKRWRQRFIVIMKRNLIAACTLIKT